MMEFFKCSIGGQVYGTGITEIEKGLAERTGTELSEVLYTNSKCCIFILKIRVHGNVVANWQ